MDLTNKTVIVNGAGGGMGKETVSLLLKMGANVIGCDLDVSALEVFQNSPNFFPFKGNMLEEATVQKVFEKAKLKYGEINGLVNVLGVAQHATAIEKVTLAEYDKIMDVNLKSVFLACREAAKYMKKQKSGKIVNIGSVSTTRPRPGLQAYVASKGAVESFTKALALEMAPDGVNVNVLHPGPADTSMLSQFAEEGANVDDVKKSVFEDSVPLGRLIQPQDIAQSILFLLSEQATMVTGAVLHVDGGRNI